jgi:type IV pilus biogenesis protein CpaD/CtpE
MNRKKYVVLAAIVSLTPLLAGCSSVLSSINGDVTLDTAKVQQIIVDGIKKQSDIDVTVECPSLMQGKPGDTRNCIATALVDGSTAKIVVTIESSQGDITWELQ